jgi:hypothetical protein
MDCAIKDEWDWIECWTYMGLLIADWAGDMDHKKSTSGYVFNLFGGEISWMRKMQSVVALSTTKV